MTTKITLELRDPAAVASVLHRGGQEEVAEQIKAQLRRVDLEVREFAELISTDFQNWGPEEVLAMVREFAENVVFAVAVTR